MQRVVLLRSNPVRPYPRLEKMAKSIKDMGNEVTILAWDRDEQYAPKEEAIFLGEEKVKIIRVGIKGEFSGGFKKNAIGLSRFEFFIFRWLTKHRGEYDIIHAYDFDCGYVASMAAKLYKKKLVYDIADYYVDSHALKGTAIGKIIESKEKKIINYADATILCTEERKKQIDGSHPKKLIIIHNTPNLPQTTYSGDRIIKQPSDRYKLVYVGILGLGRFLDKIVEVVRTRKDCEFHIGGFGGGLESMFEKYAKYNENIFFYGRLSYAQTIELERECDAMCALYDPNIPNHEYAAPNKFYEALALGKPLIMVKGTGMAEIVARENLGEVIDYTTNSLDIAITRMMTKREEYSFLSEKAKKIYDNEYSWDKMETRIRDLYKSI